MLNNDWKWEIIEHYVPSHVGDKIQGVRTPVDLDSMAFPFWTLCSDGLFSLKSSYQAINSEASPPYPTCEPIVYEDMEMEGT